jgi:mannitol/fructose-specific phosphotransferase system IIA component (Ntr-type)
MNSKHLIFLLLALPSHEQNRFIQRFLSKVSRKSGQDQVVIQIEAFVLIHLKQSTGLMVSQ